MANFRLRFLFLTLFLLTLFQSSLHAQRTFGIKWDVPEDTETAVSQLHEFKDQGISIIEVKSELSPPLWKTIDSLQFDVYGSLDIRFPIALTFQNPDSSLITTIQRKASAYLSQSSISGIQLYNHGAVWDSSFFPALNLFAEQLKNNRPIKLYDTNRYVYGRSSSIDFSIVDVFVTPANVNTFTVPQGSVIGGYIFSPSDKLKGYITPFKKFLEKTAVSSEKPVFLHDDWLAATLEKHPRFSETLQSLTTKDDAVVPLPAESIPSPRSPVTPIILLLLVWGSIGLHFNSSPLYRKSLFRYFAAHKFFINDIFQRHIRSVLPALTIILQNAILISTSVVVMFLAVFTKLGQAAFFHHFSSVAIIGEKPISIFAWAFLGVLFISLLSIIWLYISHKKINSLTQIATIYAWPLQINFIFCTVAITLFSAGGSPILITIFTALAIFIFLLSFLLSSFDTFRFAKSKMLHQINTSIPYFVIIGGLIGWFLTHPQWIDAIRLSLNLK